MRRGALALALALPTAANAHSFGKLYNLPVPLWLYLYGAVAALVLSFLVMAFFATEARDASPDEPGGGWAVPRGLCTALLRPLQAASLALLALAITSGLVGSQNAYANFNMSGFWIGFVLGFAYLTALIGPLYARINPWWLIVRGLERLTGEWRGVIPNPQRLGVWPAFALYLAFIWVELFGGTSPFSLSLLLCAYTAINVAGAWGMGTRAWFAQGEFFAVFLGWFARCAPLDWHEGRLRWQWPFAGLLRAPPLRPGETVFILFMLASTAFDGLRETAPWVALFWQHLYEALWLPLFDGDVVAAYPRLKTIYLAWQGTALLLAPWLYLAVFLACLEAARRLTRSAHGLPALALAFAPTLVPIALVYHVTHYYTLLFTQGAQLPWLLTDPLGSGSEWAWRWLGEPRGWIPDAGAVWHTQVGLIVAGHIVSVALAHVVALRVFPTPRAATLSQLPMLLLMMVYTGSGLWILAQPITSAGH